MATTTLTPYRYHHIWASSYTCYNFSDIPSSNQGTDISYVYDAAQYLGADSSSRPLGDTSYQGAVCIEYNVNLNNAYISSMTFPSDIEVYTDGSDNHIFATLSTQAPTANTSWKFINNTSVPADTRLNSPQAIRSSTSSLTISNINKTVTTSKLYLYLQIGDPNTWDRPMGCSFTRYYTNGTVNYTPSTVTISYNANGGNSTPTSQTVNLGDSTTVANAIGRSNSTATATYSLIRSTTGWTISGGSDGSLAQTTTTSYTFNGWHIDSPSGETIAASSSYTPTSDVVLYAGWDESVIEVTANLTSPTAISVTRSDGEANMTVSYNSNGGFSFYRYQSISGQATYTWDGKWYTAKEGGNEVSSNLVLTSDIIVYPHFDVTLNNVSFTFPTGEQCSRVGYKLLGWSSNSTATTPNYSPGESTSGLTSTEFYAVWAYLDTSYIFINNNGQFEKYQPYIFDGSKFCLYDAYVYDGSKWVNCGEEPYVDLITSDNKNFVTSDGKIFQVYST